MPDPNAICFFIAPIDHPGTETRRRSDQVLKHVIEPVANACGLTAIRADRISESGLITTQVIQHLMEDSMVVADLTDANPNVFYELAIRHAFRKPCIQLIRAGQRIPFDLAGVRTIDLEHTDLDSVQAAKQELERQIQRLQNDPGSVESPVTVAADRASLQRSGKPEERQLADVLDTVRLIASRMESSSWMNEKSLKMLHVIFGAVVGEKAPPLAELREIVAAWDDGTVRLADFGKRFEDGLRGIGRSRLSEMVLPRRSDPLRTTVAEPLSSSASGDPEFHQETASGSES